MVKPSDNAKAAGT